MLWGSGVPGDIKMDCASQEERAAELGVQLVFGNANLRGGKMARDRRGFGNGRGGQVL